MNAKAIRENCLVDGCTKLEELANGRSAGGFCAGHRNRKKDGKSISGALRDWGKSPFEGMVAAAMSLVDVDAEASEADWRRARKRFQNAKQRAFRAYIARLTGIESPRVIRTERLPDGTTRITFKQVKPQTGEAP